MLSSRLSRALPPEALAAASRGGWQSHLSFSVCTLPASSALGRVSSNQRIIRSRKSGDRGDLRKENFTFNGRQNWDSHLLAVAAGAIGGGLLVTFWRTREETKEEEESIQRIREDVVTFDRSSLLPRRLSLFEPDGLWQQPEFRSIFPSFFREGFLGGSGVGFISHLLSEAADSLSASRAFPYDLLPDGDQFLDSVGFSSLFSPSLKQPRVVAERFTQQTSGNVASGVAGSQGVEEEEKDERDKETEGSVDRRNFSFRREVRVERPWSPEPADYLHSGVKLRLSVHAGFSRGHLAAAALHSDSASRLAATFSLAANVSPQKQGFNAGHWFGLECLCRDLRKAYQDVFVFSGPLWLPYDAPEKLPSVHVQNLPLKESSSESEAATFVCVRPWASSTEALPVRVEALGFSQRERQSPSDSEVGDAESNSETSSATSRALLLKAFSACKKKLAEEEGARAAPVLHARHQVIGYRLLPVPSHFFKIIVAIHPRSQRKGDSQSNDTSSDGTEVKDRTESPENAKKDTPATKDSLPPALVGVFLLPNETISPSTSLDAFRVPLAFVELVSGLNFSAVADLVKETTRSHFRQTKQNGVAEERPLAKASRKDRAVNNPAAELQIREEALLEFDLCSHDWMLNSVGESKGRRRRTGNSSLCRWPRRNAIGHSRKPREPKERPSEEALHTAGSHEGGSASAEAASGSVSSEEPASANR